MRNWLPRSSLYSTLRVRSCGSVWFWTTANPADCSFILTEGTTWKETRPRDLQVKTWHPHTQWWLGPPADAPHHPPFVPRPAPPEASSPGTARTRKTDPRTRPRRTSSTILSLAGHVEPLARGNPYSTEAAGENSTTL